MNKAFRQKKNKIENSNENYISLYLNCERDSHPLLISDIL